MRRLLVMILVFGIIFGTPVNKTEAADFTYARFTSSWRWGEEKSAGGSVNWYIEEDYPEGMSGFSSPSSWNATTGEYYNYSSTRGFPFYRHSNYGETRSRYYYQYVSYEEAWGRVYINYRVDTWTRSKEYFRGDYVAMVNAPDGTYPADGGHTDGFYYVKLGPKGIGELSTDNISKQLKQDIMPVINVIVNTNFNEVISGRGYITGTLTGSGVSATAVTISGQKPAIRVTGRFTTTGIKYIELGSGANQIYLLFNVITNPTQGSASAVTF